MGLSRNKFEGQQKQEEQHPKIPNKRRPLALGDACAGFAASVRSCARAEAVFTLGRSSHPNLTFRVSHEPEDETRSPPNPLKP